MHHQQGWAALGRHHQAGEWRIAEASVVETRALNLSLRVELQGHLTGGQIKTQMPLTACTRAEVVDSTLEIAILHQPLLRRSS